MKKATLAIIWKDGQVLLGHKKKGEIGTGTINAPGGKKEDGESLVNCVIREVREELGVQLFPEYLLKIAKITFYVASVADFEVHIYWTNYFEGTPRETEDMIPAWFDIDSLPFDKMLESDREWFEKAARGHRFRANVYYKKRAADFERIEFL